MSKIPALEYPLPLSAEDAVRHALAAYYLTVHDATPPIGMPPGYGDWSSPGGFVSTFVDVFLCRVYAYAHPDSDVAAGEIVRLSKWEAAGRHPVHYRDVDPAHWAALQAEAMAQGCAAVDVGGGTAAVSSYVANDAVSNPRACALPPAKPLSPVDTG